MEHDVFISYSQADKAVAEAACSAIEAEGTRCWIAPRDIWAGTDWAESIVRAIRASSVFVLVLSDSANRSDQVVSEVNQAVDAGAAILPLRIEDILPSDRLILHLNRNQWIDALSSPREKHLKKLGQDVTRLVQLKQAGSAPLTKASQPKSGSAKASTTHGVDPVGKATLGTSNRKMKSLALATVAAGIAVLTAVHYLPFSSPPKEPNSLHPPIWKFPTNGPISRAPTAGVDGIVYVSSSSGVVYALQELTGQQLWQHSISASADSTPTVGTYGTVYVGSRTGLSALAGKSGRVLWSVRTGGSLHSPILASDGTVYAGCDDGKMYAIDAVGRIARWSFPTGGRVTAQPILGPTGELLFTSEDHYLYSIDRRSGKLNWKFQTGDWVCETPALTEDGSAYVGSGQSFIYEIDLATGRERRRLAIGGTVASGPVVGADGSIFVGSYDHYVYSIEMPSGVEKWRFRTGGWVTSRPIIGRDGTVFVASYDHYLYALDPKNGLELWAAGTKNIIQADLAKGSHNTVLVASTDGALYAQSEAPPDKAAQAR